MKNDLTLVTALFDIGRDSINPGFSRSFQHYLDCFKRLLDLNIPTVVFCDEKVHKFITDNYPSDRNIRIIKKTLDDLRNFPFFDAVQKIRNDENWKNISGWLPDSPQSSLEFYNPIVMSKQFFLNDASIFNFFDTKYFAWIDAGIANTVHIEGYFGNGDFVQKLISTMENDKMCYIAFPYDGEVEVHGFEKNALNRYAGEDTRMVVRGGFFGGTRGVINKINEIYYGLLNETLNEGYMGTEESIFTIIAYKYPHLINLYMINGDGLLYKFFDDVLNKSLVQVGKPIDEDGQIAIYVLTYNLPNQFIKWMNSFKVAYPEEFNKYPKYVFNNSDDENVREVYKKIFEENGFIEYKFDNIGINDARFEVAKHFNESPHSYMVFFEDDMFLKHQYDDYSKLGFPPYYEKVFEKAKQILIKEKLDFLKLTMDEFYGDNLENWGWYNLPQDLKQTLFPDGNRKTKIDYLGSLEGVPYAVGEFHYCNWPILFGKSGNKKVFLETIFTYNYEQTWMSLVCQKQKSGYIKSGCLLASIINHNRIYHYPRDKRKENKY